MRLYTIKTGDSTNWFSYNSDGSLYRIEFMQEYPLSPIVINYNSNGTIAEVIRSSSKSLFSARIAYFSKQKYFYTENNLIQKIIQKTSQYIGSKPFIEYSNYYQYNDVNKLISIKEYYGNKEKLKTETTYYYDFGNLNKVIDNLSSENLFNRNTLLKYNSKGSLIEKKHTDQENGKTTISKHLYAYDNNGNLSNEKIFDMDGKLLNNYLYKYNAANLIEYKNFIEKGFGRSIIRIPGFSKYEYQEGEYVDIYSLLKDFF